MVIICLLLPGSKPDRNSKPLYVRISNIYPPVIQTDSLSDSTFWETFTQWTTLICGQTWSKSTLACEFLDIRTGSTIPLLVRAYPNGKLTVFVLSAPTLMAVGATLWLLHTLFPQALLSQSKVRCYAQSRLVRLNLALPADCVGIE